MAAEIRPNIDLTKELEAPERRLDAFARLLESHSECTAVTILDGVVFITANELYTNSRSNTINNSINTIFNYFSTIVKNGRINNDERKKILEEICSEMRIKKIGRICHIPEGASKKALEDLQSHEKKSILEALLAYGNANKASVAGFTLGLFANLIRDFSKLEEGIIKKSNSAEDPTNAKITDELLSALDKKLIILADETEKGIHAEMQILSKIIKMINTNNTLKEQEIYIGISKRCCLNCHAMITAANELLKLNKITIKTRGTHGLDFTWQPPELFSGGYGNKEKIDKTTLQYRIGKRGKQIFDELVLRSKVKSEMSASQSDNDFELNLEETGTERKHLIKQSLPLFQQSNQKITVEEAVVEMGIAGKIYETAEFKKLLSQLTSIPPKKEIVKKIFHAIYQNLSESNEVTATAAS